jgi:hypothetical protein
MAYLDYGYYKTLYGDRTIAEAEFNRLLWDAEREVDSATSGVDGVRKLKIAFPTDEYDAEAVKRCICSLIVFLKEIEQAESFANVSTQYVSTEGGNMQGKIVTSVSAGNESISYAVGKTFDTASIAAIKSASDKRQMIYQLIVSKLSGISDANGVNLLYAGRYPYFKST